MTSEQISIIKTNGKNVEWFKVWLRNAKSAHHRLMAIFLRKRGWVVFYLEEEARKCKGVCWMELYMQSERRPGGE